MLLIALLNRTSALCGAICQVQFFYWHVHCVKRDARHNACHSFNSLTCCEGCNATSKSYQRKIFWLSRLVFTIAEFVGQVYKSSFFFCNGMHLMSDGMRNATSLSFACHLAFFIGMLQTNNAMGCGKTFFVVCAMHNLGSAVFGTFKLRECAMQPHRVSCFHS